MEKRMCSKCKTERPIEVFYRKKDRYTSWCKYCLYERQKRRWRDRKRKAVELFGGKCCLCDYKKNLAALDFHHKNPKMKDFDWSQLKLRTWARIIEELKKCILVCKNCHAEIHWPDNNINLKCLDEDNVALNFTSKEFAPTGKCPICDCDVYGTKYCSVEHAKVGNRKVKRPRKTTLERKMTTTSMVKIGKEYGVSDNAVRKWAKIYGLIS